MGLVKSFSGLISLLSGFASNVQKAKNRQKSPSRGVLTVYLVAGTGLEPVTFGL